MTRGRAAAKAGGRWLERVTAAYLATHLGDDRIERRRQTGAKDRGDVAGVRFMGARVVVECKEYGGKLLVGPWVDQAEVERGNDDATSALVVAKRRGTTKPGDQYVLMTLRDLVALMTGTRPTE
jgi:hypothetical protein